MAPVLDDSDSGNDGDSGHREAPSHDRPTQPGLAGANRVNFVCVTTPSRIPALQTKRVDIIVSTLTWTKARTEVIDFSIPYYGATGRLAVNKTSSIQSIIDRELTQFVAQLNEAVAA